MKKGILISFVVLIAILLLIKLDKVTRKTDAASNNQTPDKTSAFEKINNSSFKRKKIITSSSKLSASKKIDINKMLPCDALKFLSKDKTPWSYLEPNDYSRYNDMIDSLRDIENLDQFSEEKKTKVPQQIKLYTEYGSVPFIYDIHNKIINSKASKEVKSFFSDYLYSSLLGSTSLNSNLYLVRYLISIKDYEQAKEKIKYIANSKPSTSYTITGTRDNIYSSAKTPSEIAAAIETLSRAPTYDLSFLISLQKNKKFNISQTSLDAIAEKIINETLNYKDPQDINYLSYEVALRVHSKRELLKKKYGTREQLTNRVMLAHTIDNSKTCDDRELIDLCEKYCLRWKIK